MKYLSRPTLTLFGGFDLARCCWLVWGFGLACAAAAQNHPPLYVCPGTLFTNDLAPALAKARGCELASRGRLSQAQDTVSQAMAAADTEARPALAAPEAGPALRPNSAPTMSPQSATPSTHTSTSTATPSAASTTTLAAPAASAGWMTAPAAPTTTAARKAPEPSADAHRQRQRDSHAREIVLAELARTQARIQTLSAQPPAGPEAESALQRLQRDEDALRRELARRPG